MCYDVRLSHLNTDYLLTYLLTYLITYVQSRLSLSPACVQAPSRPKVAETVTQPATNDTPVVTAVRGPSGHPHRDLHRGPMLARLGAAGATTPAVRAGGADCAVDPRGTAQRVG